MLEMAIDDNRPIKSITTRGDGGVTWCVGHRDVTRIVAYGENGQEAAVTWFAVYTGDHLASRVNGAAVEHIWYGYGEAPEDTKEIQ